MKKPSSEAPTTTDGAAMSARITRSLNARPRNRYRASASAAGVPSAVAISVLSEAISSEWTSADVRSGMSNRWRYHSRVNPFHAKVSRPEGALLKP